MGLPCGLEQCWDGLVRRVEMAEQSMWTSGKWSCHGLDVRRSMHLESMRYQLDREGAAGPRCVE